MDLVYSILLHDSEVDSLCWQQNSKKGFTVSSFYRCLTAPATMQFPWKGIWKPKVPPQVAFFVWTAALGKILTNDNLRKRRVVLVNWCKAEGESVDPLFLFFGEAIMGYCADSIWF